MKKIGKQLAILLVTLSLLLGCVTIGFAAQALPFADSEFYTQGDYEIHYRVIPAEGEKIGQIFMIHGFVSSTVFWENLAAKMSAAGYECVLADLPGFGYSTRETKATTPIDREDLMVGLMQQLAPGEQWIVAGHSMGGGVALNIATANPELVERLMLYAPAAGIGMETMFADMSEPQLLIYGFLLNTFARIILNIEPIVRLLFLQATAEPLLAFSYDIARITDPLKLDNTGSSLLYSMRHARQADFAAAAALEMPILLVWADYDALVTPGGSTQLMEALSQATVKQVKSGHMFPETRAQETADLTLAFLAA